MNSRKDRQKDGVFVRGRRTYVLNKHLDKISVRKLNWPKTYLWKINIDPYLIYNIQQKL